LPIKFYGIWNILKNLRIYTNQNYFVNKKNIHSFISLLKQEIGVIIESLDINFVDNNYILEINKQYLKHNYITDIITFGYSKKIDTINAEIFISLEEASSNAAIYKCSLNEEVYRLLIHGFMHLMNYYDKTEKQKKIMQMKEDEYLKLFAKFINNNYIVE